MPGLDLGHQPVSDLILTRAQLNRPETFYPMQLHHCPECGLTQLGYIVSPKVVYKNFPFVSGTTRTATEHLQGLARLLVEVGSLGPDSFAVDIGSNDGTLLKGFVPYGVRFLGIDPSGDPVRIANEQGIPTLHDFFTEESARGIRDEHGAADAISAAGVFGHIADLASVMRGVDALLAPEGVFLTENQYWLDMVERLHYDNMFHQHLRYYSMRPLLRLYADYDLEIFDVRRSEVYGGSITRARRQAGEAPRGAAGRRAARGGGGGGPLRRAHVAAVRGRGRGSPAHALRRRPRAGAGRARRSSASARPRRRRPSATTAGSGLTSSTT